MSTNPLYDPLPLMIIVDALFTASQLFDTIVGEKFKSLFYFFLVKDALCGLGLALLVLREIITCS